jgi:predicted nucleic acid-binding protein
MTLLCDTNVISELVRRTPNPGVLAWATTRSSFALSVITVEEVLFGLSWRPSARLEAWFAETLVPRCDIFPITDAIARRAGRLRGGFSARGEVRTQADMLIAATAQVHQLTLVTRNVRDFEGCGIGLLDPFT